MSKHFQLIFRVYNIYCSLKTHSVDRTAFFLSWTLLPHFEFDTGIDKNANPGFSRQQKIKYNIYEKNFYFALIC